MSLETSTDRLLPVSADQSTEQGRAEALKAEFDALAGSTDAVALSRARTARITAEIDDPNAQLAQAKSGAEPPEVEESTGSLHSRHRIPDR